MKTVKDLCTEYGYSQTALAKRFDIPLRTVQDWHSERRTPPRYIVPMMEEILKREKSKSPSLQRLKSDLEDCRAEVRAFKAEANNILDHTPTDTAKGLAYFTKIECKRNALIYAQESITDAIGFIGLTDDYDAL